MDHDDDGMEGHSDDPVSPMSPTSAKDNSRKRSSRACDQCRKAKSRCDPAPDDGPCKSCILSGIACTFQGPSQKRGPPKGYLNALETRLHEAEALLGAIISSPQAEGLVAVLSKDPLAGQIITRVNKSIFGALGRPHAGQPEAGSSRGRRRPDKARQRMSNSKMLYSRESGSPIFTSPSYAWQDHLNEQLATTNQSSVTTECGQSGSMNVSDSVSDTWWKGDRRQKRRTDNGGPLRLDIESANQVVYAASASANDCYSELESTDFSGVGNLSLDNDMQVRYLGESSGLTLLSQCPRSDTLYSQQMWRFPQTSAYGQSGNSGPLSFDHAERQVRLPSISTQEHLLRQYFHYVHPIFPIVDRDKFWDEWTSLQKFHTGGPPKMLLLAMFALVARYPDTEDSGQSNYDSSVDDSSYMEDVQILLNKSFESSRLSTCQALLLLGYRAIGISGLKDASLFLVMGIQMALDLGLNRHADEWTRDGSCVISQNVLRMRRSVWYGCVVLDAFIAAQLGRPLRIHREDYDTRLPDVDTQEDFQLWMPYRNTGTSQGYNPLPSRITSCFRFLSSIAEIFSLVLDRLYAVNPDRTTAQRRAEFLEIDQKLQRWYMELPETLRSTASPVPPPHVLCLHMSYWCSVLLLQCPHLFHDALSISSPDESTRRSHRALDLGAAAAANLTNLAQTYNNTFGLRHSPALLIYYILVACVMHVTVLQLHPEDVQANLGLSHGMSCLEDLKETWPAASQAYALIHGANVNRQDPPVARNNQSRKRTLEESSATRSYSQSDDTGSGSIQPRSSHGEMNIFHHSQFMELTHSLGLDPSGLNSVFDVPTYNTRLSNDKAFTDVQGDISRNHAMIRRS